MTVIATVWRTAFLFAFSLLIIPDAEVNNHASEASARDRYCIR
uniref:Uncharacterized protein n=1 Tax=Anguilla anguilla TaxID=7936 RepID=A0A0E9P9Z1_ANGAN